ERIGYNLGSTPRHGIYRDIPIDYRDGKDTYYVTAKHTGTTDEKGHKVQAETSENNGNYRIRLGDPDVGDLTGLHIYNISYELSPIITKKDGKPFLNIDAIGTGWPVPILSATVSLQLENDAPLSNAKCFIGSQGSTQACAQFGKATQLSPYQGMSINANLPDGYVATYLQPNQKRPVDIWPIITGVGVFVLFGGIFVVAMVIIFLRWWQSHSKRKRQIVVAQYEPPASLSPAEIGHLEDDSSDMAEVTATLISLAVRGYLKVTQKEKTGIGGIFGGSEYVLNSLKSSQDLPPEQAALFNAFFSTGKEVKLNDLNKSTMASAITSFKSATKKSLENKGFYDKGGGVLQKGTLTDLGAKEWALVDGFKLYLNVVEKDRLKFTDAPEKTPERFSKLLPYAIALGVEKQWAKQFEGIDITQSTNNWYHGNNMAAFSAGSLVSDLNSGFASAVSTNTSVSSSGGSSGGGFGGGGGGSW
ncbi:MAG: DUF2207 domain-containing protein, partial [Patescibacteria group bacterium]